MVSLQEPSEVAHVRVQDETITITQVLTAALHTLAARGPWSRFPIHEMPTWTHIKINIYTPQTVQPQEC